MLPGNIGNGAITSAKIGAGAVIASSIKNGVITTNKLQQQSRDHDKLAANAVTNPILANGSVTLAKLSDELRRRCWATLKSGQTLRGVFDLGGAGSAGDDRVGAVSFQFPLLNAPAVERAAAGPRRPPTAPGLGGGGQTPAATAGNLCVYVTGRRTSTKRSSARRRATTPGSASASLAKVEEAGRRHTSPTASGR